MTTTLPDRPCPQCAALNASDAVRCDCGYVFATTTPASGHLVAQAEALYEYYLSTRLARAVKAVKAARRELLRDPENPERANDLKQAEEEVRLLQAQLALQAVRAAQAQRGAAVPDPARVPTSAVGTQEPSQAFSERQAARAAAITARPEEVTRALGISSTTEFSLAQNQRAERVTREQPPAHAVESNLPPFISDDELAALRRPGAFSPKG